MNGQEFEIWRMNCKKEVYAQILLNSLKKKGKIKRKKEKEIQIKINLIGYKNFLNSPHLEGKEELKKKIAKLCFNNYCSSIGITENSPFRQGTNSA